MKASLEVRLWLGLDWDRPDEECWEWQECKGSDGYGIISYGKSNMKVHRAVYELAHGVKLEPRDKILHLCDNRLCANPNHLLRGSQLDNKFDEALKGVKGKFERLSESYARFLYEKLKLRFEGDPDKGKGCGY